MILFINPLKSSTVGLRLSEDGHFQVFPEMFNNCKVGIQLSVSESPILKNICRSSDRDTQRFPTVVQCLISQARFKICSVMR